MSAIGPRLIDGILVFEDPDERTMQQARTVASAGDVVRTVLCADAHLGYSMPIGGVVAYRDTVSPSGVGYDISSSPNRRGRVGLHPALCPRVRRQRPSSVVPEHGRKTVVVPAQARSAHRRKDG